MKKKSCKGRKKSDLFLSLISNGYFGHNVTASLVINYCL